MESPIVAALVKSTILPAVVATMAFFVIGFLKEPWRARLQALVLAAAFSVGAYVLIQRLQFPPTDAGESFTWAAILLSLFVFVRPQPIGSRYLVRALFVLALGAVILWPLRQTLFSPIYYRNLVAFFCLGLGIWSIVEKAVGKVRPSTLILLPMIAATALSLLMLFAASASYSQIVGVACALFGGAFAISLFFPQRISQNGFVPFLSVFVVMLMMAGHFYLDINPWHMVYLCLPYLVLWLREWFGFVPQKTVPEAIVFGAVSAAPLAYFIYGIGVKVGLPT